MKTHILSDVSDIKIFHSNPTMIQMEEALQMARLDHDQHHIVSIRAHWEILLNVIVCGMN